MTTKLPRSEPEPEPEPASATAAWTKLSKAGRGFLFEVTGKPWTAWLGVLAATIAVLLGLAGMQDDGMIISHSRARESENLLPFTE
ncbi:hypothetical protein TSTA_026610 [Talaromyces stipitatus ATCC 10500]|uniref:Uncharacterized protein n=1 Tax=Talaromyces stipitatus (strain ATCC 10500 / CBS 375.48 / QM 6759 / NRRL 1006) TaxID=441959 RepID=B8M4R9_TALSN|nr:uncharacterized protein TSTA_026610 [Talaromyces stipitatus ATCC 10500]EED19354.1 hypothetical protein TSTA_026610 [Talaromyces stipitatus ATCC 10500]